MRSKYEVWGCTGLIFCLVLNRNISLRRIWSLQILCKSIWRECIQLCHLSQLYNWISEYLEFYSEEIQCLLSLDRVHRVIPDNTLSTQNEGMNAFKLRFPNKRLSISLLVTEVVLLSMRILPLAIFLISNMSEILALAMILNIVRDELNFHDLVSKHIQCMFFQPFSQKSYLTGVLLLERLSS